MEYAIRKLIDRKVKRNDLRN